MRKARRGEPPPFSRSAERRFGNSTCFLCARRLTKATRTDEHVVSNWVQRRFGLHNQSLTLLNNTTIRYALLKIPCCVDCNTIHLQKVEDRIIKAVGAGPSAVRALDPLTLYVWLGKTFYGLLHKELFLRLDRRSTRKTTIVRREALRQLSVLHYCLQAARVPFRVTAHPGVRFPLGSIFVYELQAETIPGTRFDLRDSTFGMVLSLALGNVGLVACFGDGGVLREAFDDIEERLAPHKLHYLQFSEITAQLFYAAHRLERRPKYVLTSGPDGIEVMVMPVGGFSSRPLLAPWRAEEYVQGLSACIRAPVDQLISPDRERVWTCLFDAEGRFVPLTAPATSR